MENLIETFGNLSPVLVYCGLFLGAYIENIFPPVPGDSIVVFGAYLVGIGTLRIELAFICTTVGSVLGFMTYFYLGRFLGKKYITSGRLRIVTYDKYERVEKWFARYGYWVIAANRFLSGARSVISFTAGAVKLEQIKAFLLALLSCALWNWILLLAGYKVGENWDVVIHYLKAYNKIVFGIILVIVACYAAGKWISRKRSK